MKLYEFAPAPSAIRVSIFLGELNLNIERVHVDIRGGENLSEQFKRKAVNGKIPFLELDDGTTICESVAICRYLEATTVVKSSLFGDTPWEQAQVEMWHRVVEFQGLVPAMQAFRNISGLFKDRENIVEAWGEESRQRLIDFLPTLDKQLATNNYIAGNTFSIVDITAFCMINFIHVLKIELDDSLPDLQRWFNQVAQRPSIKGLAS
jgi:glutathione S-transferase